MLIWRDSFTRACVLATLFLPTTVEAKDFDVESWRQTFHLMGAAAGAYDACGQRDHLQLFHDMAETLVVGIGSNDPALIVDLEDSARFAYFFALSSACDVRAALVGRDDVSTWSNAITKAAGGGPKK